MVRLRLLTLLVLLGMLVQTLSAPLNSAAQRPADPPVLTPTPLPGGTGREARDQTTGQTISLGIGHF